MLARSLLIGILGLVSVPALAAAGSAESSHFRTITIQPGQGAAVSFQVPNTPNGDVPQAPYALTGQAADETQLPLVSMRTGQGDLVWVRFAD